MTMDKHPSMITVSAISVALASARNKRRRNEDAIGIDGWVLHGEDVNPLDVVLRTGSRRPTVLALTDGLGGAPDGDLAARLAARILTDRHVHQAGTRQTMLAAFEQADDALHTAGVGESQGMGCTAAVVMVHRDGRVLVGNIGDVRAYRFVDGYLGQLTQDDRLATDAAVSRCLGGRYRTEAGPHLHEVGVLPGDRLLLCTDGLYDAIAQTEIERTLRTVEGAGHAAAALVRAAKESAHEDNITVAVVDVVGPASGAPATAERPAAVSEPERKPSRWERIRERLP